MRKLLIGVLLVIAVLVIYYLSIPNVSPETGASIRTLIDEKTQAMQVGEQTEIDIKTEYDFLIIVPPYFTEETLHEFHLNGTLIRSIMKSRTFDETYQLFVIKDNQIHNNVILSGKFATQNNKPLIITFPEKLPVRKVAESDYRWFEIVTER